MESVRLQKFLSDAGVCSRRAAEAMIEAGEVAVNGEPARLGQKVQAGIDRVTVRGRLVGATVTAAAGKVTLAVFKPRGMVCGTPDGRHPSTVFDLIPREFARARFLLVGRLDLEAEGLVLLTADGALADQLSRASGQIVRRYRVSLATPFPRGRLGQLLKGVRLEDELVQAAQAFLLHPNTSDESPDLEVHVTHGRGRGLRELFGALGFNVERLQCFQIGALKLHGMPLRSARVLTRHDIESLTRSPAGTSP